MKHPRLLLMSIILAVGLWTYAKSAKADEAFLKDVFSSMTCAELNETSRVAAGELARIGGMVKSCFETFSEDRMWPCEVYRPPFTFWLESTKVLTDLVREKCEV